MTRSTTPTDEAMVREVAALAHRLIHELHAQNPGDETFTQVGLLDGRETVVDYLGHGEFGLALEHLLYMVHESNIDFPQQLVLALHDLASGTLNVSNFYALSNQGQWINSLFNVPTRAPQRGQEEEG